MYINNITKKPITNISFEGYWFTVPAGVSIVWDKFGKFLTEVIYKIDGTGGGMPPVVEATAAEWDGKQYAEVRRFEINAEHIPNKNDLIKIAKQRGVDAETIEQWKEDESLENADIAKAINELAVPDFVKYPEAVEVPAAKTDTSMTDAADDLINEPAKTPVPPVTKPATKPVAATRTPRTPRQTAKK
jgi:hypothetical protein